MTIRRYFPAFVDVADDERVVAEFTSKEELMDIPWVAHFRDKNFDKFSISDKCLMAEYKNPRTWWVIGFFEGDYDLGLPKLDTSK